MASVAHGDEAVAEVPGREPAPRAGGDEQGFIRSLCGGSANGAVVDLHGVVLSSSFIAQDVVPTRVGGTAPLEQDQGIAQAAIQVAGQTSHGWMPPLEAWLPIVVESTIWPYRDAKGGILASGARPVVGLATADPAYCNGTPMELS